MFVSKHFRNFVHSRAVSSLLHGCIFEVAPANLLQISFSLLNISSKKCVAHQKLNLLCSRLAHEREKFFAKLSANR